MAPARRASARSRSGAPMGVSPQEIWGDVVKAAGSHGVDQIEAIIEGSNEALTRFANNTIHQNVAEQSTHLSVRPVIDGRTARASTNRVDPEGIREVVEQAIAITRLTAPDPDLVALLDH